MPHKLVVSLKHMGRIIQPFILLVCFQSLSSPNDSLLCAYKLNPSRRAIGASGIEKVSYDATLDWLLINVRSAPIGTVPKVHLVNEVRLDPFIAAAVAVGSNQISNTIPPPRNG